jgi:hypothetical protein
MRAPWIPKALNATNQMRRRVNPPEARHLSIHIEIYIRTLSSLPDQQRDSDGIKECGKALGIYGVKAVDYVMRLQ